MKFGVKYLELMVQGWGFGGFGLKEHRVVVARVVGLLAQRRRRLDLRAPFGIQYSVFGIEFYGG